VFTNTPAKLRVTGPKFNKFVADVEGSSLVHPTNLRSSRPLWNASAQNEGVYANFRRFAPNRLQVIKFKLYNATVCNISSAMACKFSTLWFKKTIHLTFDHNFGKCRPIFKILSLTDFQGNSSFNYCKATLTVLLCYLVKLENHNCCRFQRRIVRETSEFILLDMRPS